MRAAGTLLAAAALACTDPKPAGDTGPGPEPPPDPCTLALPLDHDAPMPFWDASISELLGPHPTAPLAGPLLRADGREGELRLGLSWAPHPRDAVVWQHDPSSETPCTSVFSTTFTLDGISVDGVELTGARVHGARLTSEGVATVEVFADAAGVADTVLEPPSGRDTLCVGLRLLALLPAEPGEEPAWTVELWADEDARWSASPELFPFATGTLPWVAAGAG